MIKSVLLRYMYISIENLGPDTNAGNKYECGAHFSTKNELPQMEIIASEASFLVCSMAWIFYIYMFQVVRCSVNVLNVSMCI